MTDNLQNQKEITKLRADTVKLQKLVATLLNYAQQAQRDIRTLKAKCDGLNNELARVSSKLRNRE